MPVEAGHAAKAQCPRPTTAPRVRIMGLRDRAGWDRYVRSHPQGTLFHTVHWTAAVEEVFGHPYFGLLIERDGGVAGALPLTLVRSVLAGPMLVSVAYGVGGGILADNEEDAIRLWSEALALADGLGVSRIELRSESAGVPGLPVIDRYVGFRKALPERPDEVLSTLPRKARAEARQARARHGLIAELGAAHLRLVWTLYARSMRRLGSPAYPYRIFRTLIERFAGDAFVQIVRVGDRPIAGLISFRHQDTFMPYFAGCDERYNHLGTNNFLYLAAMEHAVACGCRTFDFGRSRRDNTGAYDFKRFQGFEARPLRYQCWQREGTRSAELTPSNPAFGWARRVWQTLPLPAVELAGAWASRHIPG